MRKTSLDHERERKEKKGEKDMLDREEWVIQIQCSRERDKKTLDQNKDT